MTCSNAEPENFDAVLVVGHSYAGPGPATIVNSNGWLARLSSGADLDTDCRQFNPIGAIGAACLAVSEAFKRLIAVRPERGEAIDRLQFSFFNYDSGNSNPGPQLPKLIHCDFVLVGCGAIGSGVTYALSCLPLAGSIDLVDPQVYALENLGTSVLVCPGDIGIAKAVKCATLLAKPGLLATPYVEKVEQYAVRPHAKYKAVLSALDSVVARHAVQGHLWPDVSIDGAIGDFQAQVFRHIWTKNDACLQCYFKEPAIDGDKIAADATGLRLDRIRDQQAVITDADIEQASAEMKPWLIQRRNQTICS
ncbi:MAG: ThiF family adenylyltransferase, partial [Ktedonobacteraceae bacterium]